MSSVFETEQAIRGLCDDLADAHEAARVAAIRNEELLGCINAFHGGLERLGALMPSDADSTRVSNAVTAVNDNLLDAHLTLQPVAEETDNALVRAAMSDIALSLGGMGAVTYPDHTAEPSVRHTAAEITAKISRARSLVGALLNLTEDTQVACTTLGDTLSAASGATSMAHDELEHYLNDTVKGHSV